MWRARWMSEPLPAPHYGYGGSFADCCASAPRPRRDPQASLRTHSAAKQRGVRRLAAGAGAAGVYRCVVKQVAPMKRDSWGEKGLHAAAAFASETDS